MASVKFLLMSGGGDGLGIALKLKQEGNQVTVWVKEGRAKHNYDGLLRKVQRWDEGLDPDTIVVFDSNGGGRTADRLRARGHFVVTGSTFADQLELDREVAFELMQQVGIKVPHAETFRDWEKAKRYVEEKGEAAVFKASGKTADHLGTYKSYDAQDMLEMLDHFKDTTPGKPEFELQDIVKGVEVSTEGWFNGHDWMTPWNHTIERKAVMNDDLGGSAGCAGNIVWTTVDSNPVVEKGIKLMGPLLAEHGYVGPIDLNTIVNEEGVWALEFTPRFGYDAFPTLLELFDAPLGETLASLAQGMHPTQLPMKNLALAGGLRLSVPPYPSEQYAPDAGMPIRGWGREDRPHLYFYDVMLDPRNKLVNTAAFGAIATLTMKGDDIVTIMDQLEDMADRAKVPDKQYRTDLKPLFVKQFAELDRFIHPKEEEPVAPNSELVVANQDS